MKDKIFYVIEDESSYYWAGYLKDKPELFHWTGDIEKAFSCDTYEEMVIIVEKFDVEGSIVEHMWVYESDERNDPNFQHLK